LKSEFKVKVIEEELIYEGKKLNKIFYYIMEGGKEIHLSNELPLNEQIFILAREIGYRTQKLEMRPKSSMIGNLDSFDQLYNHFKASYFASSLLIPESLIIEDLKEWFKESEWKMDNLQMMMNKYRTSAESLFHRITQILPKHFGINHLFFLRYEYDMKLERYEIARELHLSSLHGPHRIKGHEHYCARWLVSKITQSVISSDEKVKMGVQRSNFVDSRQEYLIIGSAFKPKLNSQKLTSICLGLLVNDNLNDHLKYLNSPQISKFNVGETCERCSIAECKERRAPQDIPLDFFN
jgi:hypothetical protein